MPVDTYSSVLGFLKMGTGNDNNSWGDNCTLSVFQIFEDAIAGSLSSAVTGGTLDLSTAPPPAGASLARYSLLIFTGTLTANQTLKVPNLTKKWTIFNNTSGAFDFYMQTPSGTAILIPQGMHCDVWCDGANTLRRIGARTGEIFAHGGTTAPPGALVCDGTALSRTLKGRELYGQIGTTWGVGDGVTTYNIPDLVTAGRFLRSQTVSTPVGTLQAGQNAAHTHTFSASGTASGTTGAAGGHTHTATSTVTDPGHAHTVHASGNIFYAAGGTGPSPVGSDTNTSTNTTGITVSTAITSVADHTHSFSSAVSISGTTDSFGGSEARPINASVLMCIWL